MSNVNEISYCCEQVQKTGYALKRARASHAQCHEIGDLVLQLEGYDKLWPTTFDARTFIELRTALAGMDSTLRHLEREHKAAQAHVLEAIDLDTEIGAFEKLNQTPPDRNGMTLKDTFNAELANASTRIGNLEVVYDLFIEHIKSLQNILGI